MLPTICNRQRFFHIVPTKHKSKVMLAMKQFEKDIGSLETMIKDATLEEKSQEVTQFLNSAVKTFRSL